MPRLEAQSVCHEAVTSPVRRALVFIEQSLWDDAVCLDDVAHATRLSRYQLSRVFVAVTGVPVMHYVRARRLTEAARSAAGAPDILTLALDCGYGSHEAFTRAFNNRFHVTPESVRARGHTGGLDLMEALTMSDRNVVAVAPPRETLGPARLVAGLKERYTFDTNHGIPALWQRFVPRIASIPDIVDSGTYGVCCNASGDGEFDYLAAVEVSSIDRLPEGFDHVHIPASRYAVFEHNGHVSGIRDTVHAIWNHALPASGYTPASAPDFEYYAAQHFDPETGAGRIEIWIPIC